MCHSTFALPRLGHINDGAGNMTPHPTRVSILLSWETIHGGSQWCYAAFPSGSLGLQQRHSSAMTGHCSFCDSDSHKHVSPMVPSLSCEHPCLSAQHGSACSYAPVPPWFTLPLFSDLLLR